jgi:hypothetical protein
MLDLQSAVELDEFWRATKRLLASAMPHHSCSLILGIVDYQPLASRHHVAVNKEQEKSPAQQPQHCATVSGRPPAAQTSYRRCQPAIRDRGVAAVAESE